MRTMLRSSSSLLTLLSLFYFFLACIGNVSAQDSIGCFVSGECKGSTYIAIDQVTESVECLRNCKDQVGCQYWTYYENEGACFSFVSCTNLNDVNCVGCVSGDVTCQERQCDLEGQCDGSLVKFDVVASRDQCVDLCQITNGCNWWTFNSMTSYCVLAGDCSILDPSCTSCVAGERDCEVNVAPPVEEDLTKLFVLGGFDGFVRHADAEIIDLASGNMTAGACVQPVEFLYDIEEAVGLNVDGAPMICGGYGSKNMPSGAESVYSECFIWDAENNTWNQGATMLSERARAAGVVWDDGAVWIAGGRDNERSILKSSEVYYNGMFHIGPNMPEELEFHCITKVAENIAIMMGGYNYHSSHSREAYVFDYETGNFSRINDMIDGRYGHICEVVRSQNGGAEVVVAGGGLNRNSVDILSLSTMEWRAGPILPKPISWAQSVAFGDSFLLIGGGDGGGNYYDTIYEYDPNGEAWIERSETIHEAKYDFTAVMLDTTEVVCGGGNQTSLPTFF